MSKLNGNQYWRLANAYMRRYGATYGEASRAVRSVQRRGADSPHYADVMAPVREAHDAAVEAFAPLRDHARATLGRIKEMWRPVAEWAQTPEGQAQLAAWRAEREVEEARQDNACMCLCSVVHGGEKAGVCVGQATTTTAHWSETTGRVDVPVCDECAAERTAVVR